MNAKNIFLAPMDKTHVKRRSVISAVALVLIAVLLLAGFIGVRQGWLKMEMTRRGVSFSLVRETEPDTDSFDPAVVLDAPADETAARP